MSDVPASVLVVDDNPGKRMALLAALAPLGLDVVEAESGGAGLRALLAREFAVVLLDINLPDMDGYEVA
ncbi:MAG: response regulator, partial [Sulfuricaulis sp.]|nr:response regulator [Sulfuricaulis sp.]